MNDFSGMKLGRRAVVHCAERKMLGHRVMELLPAAPDSVDNTMGITRFGQMMNDSLGDCTCAGLGHSIQVATANTGAEETPADAIVLSAYEKYCGYVPGNPSTDQGGIEDDVLSGVQRDGFAGHKLLGRVSLDARNIEHVKRAIAYFGSIYIGAELPTSSQRSGVWDVVSGPEGVAGSWGGHCMVGPKYDRFLVDWITWGMLQSSTWAWTQAYMDECHVLLWDCWMKKFPLATQQSVMQLLNSL